MLELVTLHHVALAVTDLARAKQFYEDVLGLETIPRPAFPFAGEWYAAAAGAALHVHLIVVDKRVLNEDRQLQMADAHFALRVKSFRAALAHLESLGYRDDGGNSQQSMRVQTRGVTGFPQIHIFDPDRNVIEINSAVLD
jgi:catechol 2,3-dioxygenase-like lactoylglutathione lyase family enzyme